MGWSTRRSLALGLVLACLPGATRIGAQDTERERSAAIAVADAALAAITRGDMSALADLMIPEAISMPVGTRDGVTRYGMRTREIIRKSPVPEQVIERGWNAEARVSGPVAMVWYPYDLYLDGEWSHCGADVFTLVRSDGKWRIAMLAWSVLQPPACEKHPQGPPAGAKP